MARAACHQRKPRSPKTSLIAHANTSSPTDGFTLKDKQCPLESVPDLGYHYAPLDYVFGSNVLTNATLTIPSGTVLGTFTPGSNTHGLLLHSGANVIGSGSPTSLARIVRYNMVQEQATDAWSSTNVGAQIRIPNQFTATAPVLNFRFTDWSVPEGTPWHFDARPTNRTELVFRDCQFTAGKIRSTLAQVAYTNNLFNRVNGYAEENPPVTITNRFYNNTAYAGTWTFYNSASGPWEVFNNAFYATADLSTDAAGVLHGWNAYMPGSPMVDSAVSNSIVTNIVFRTGPLGLFYLTNTSPIINRGKTNASIYGLAQHTIVTNQNKDTALVDIGFHYIALNAANNPLDSDGDTLADYTEDANGNDVTDSGESMINDIDSDYDGRSDPQERADGTDPLVSGNVVLTRLAYFPFNDTNWLGSAGQTPLASSNAVSKDAWITKGLSIETNTTAFLKYRDLEPDTSANINLRNGAVRFWFRTPAWDTGAAPETNGVLIEVGQRGIPGDETNGWWALYFNTNGTDLIFTSETNSLGASYVTGAVSWARCDWNQIVLNYTPTNTALYLNSSLVATGLGVIYWPETWIRNYGLRVGSDINGSRRARGLFEDLETFNYPLSTNDIAENFRTNRPPNAIPNLKMWLHAGAGLVMTNAPDRVRIWQDQTCNSNDATQIFVEGQPYLVTNAAAGRPVVRFFGSNLFALKPFLTNATEADAFIVVKCKSDTPDLPRGFWKLGSVGNIYPSTQGAISEDFGADTFYQIGSPVNLTNTHLFNVSSRSGEWIARLNGVTRFIQASHTLAFHSAPLLGRGDTGGSVYAFDGDIAEVLIYDRVLVSAERETISQYLNMKYALVATAPAPPTNISAIAVSPTQVSVWWAAARSTNRTTFIIERKTGASGIYSKIATNTDNWSLIDTSLASGTEYFYRVKAANFAGESLYSNETNATTLAIGTNVPLDSILWLKADAGVPLSKQQRIPMWLDQSSSGNHGRAATTGPFVTNVPYGRPVARFHGSESIAHPSGTFSGLSSAEVFVVLRGDFAGSGLGDNGLWEFGGTPGNSYPYHTGRILEDFGSAVKHEVAYATNLGITAYHLLNISSKTNNWIFRKDGQQIYAAGANTVAFTRNPPVLGDGSDNGFFGNIFELVIYPRVLTTDERSAVEIYLNSKHLP